MLSDSTLERVSVAYRKGYRDGYAARDKFFEVKPEYVKPFASFDYEEGYKAGANDAKWTACAWLEETQRRQVLGLMFSGDDAPVSHMAFWHISRVQGAGPCWQWPFNTIQVLQTL